MALEIIEKDNQFRVKLQVNFTEKDQDGSLEVEERGEGEKEGEVYVAQSGDGRRKAKPTKKVVEFYTDWLPDTPINRQVLVVGLRQLGTERGEALFTLRELGGMLGSTNRQAASQHLEDFRESGQDFEEFIRRSRKVDREVVEAVEQEIDKAVWSSKEGIAKQVNKRLFRR